ncbi:Gfo/Idh/MocA family oxidoreductase [Paenibacillus sp. HB172176]|uniref:Gfo/Idh/MocA family protein n=1 Tax=Paenibacillus sp. HB172176 TaxID=2493690 RepID=UPI00143A7F7A|nr:Gfo/Idh/MocA family oxidoreductase [Paenibacillus sp. HB172176]
MSTQQKIKVGIIGQGRSGRNIHAKLLSQMPEHYEIIAVSDPHEPFRQAAEKDFGCESYVDYGQMLARKDIDLIVNASPSHLHVPLTIEALNAGKHVICEKPLARASSEVDELIRTAEKTGKKLTVFQQARFLPHFEQICKIIDSGVLGRISMIRIATNSFSRRWDWQTLQEYNGGTLLNTCPHSIDQALHLLGDVDPEVLCRLDRMNTFGDAEDFVKLLLHKPDYPIIDLEASNCDAFKGPSYHIDAQYGGLVSYQDSISWKYYKPEEAPQQKLIREPLKNADGSPAFCTENLNMHEESWVPSEEQKNALQYAGKKLYYQLYGALVHDTEVPVTAKQVRRQIAVVEKCHEQNPLSRLDR